MLENDNFALVLGGGSARGIIHAGVIKYLREKDLRPKVIAGTSAGAIIGAFYASGLSDEKMEETLGSLRIRKFLDFDFLNKGGLIRGTKHDKWLYENLGDISFADLEIPLKVNATDFNTGEEIIFSKGKLVPAIRASMNFPIIFLPYHYAGRTLIDGGVVNNLPISLVKQYKVKKFLIVNPYNKGKWPNGKNKRLNSWEVMERTIKLYSMSRYQRELKDLPGKIYLQYENSDINVYDFYKAKEIIQDGYNMARRVINV